MRDGRRRRAPAPRAVPRRGGAGPARHHPVRASTGPTSTRWRRWPAATRTRWWRSSRQQPLTVAVVGFSPGFAYLDGLPDAAARACPRRDRPRPAVPAGSVALANGHAAVYPTASPGGWQLVGRTGVPLFSPTRPPTPRWRRATGCSFTVAGAGEPVEPAPVAAPAWSPPAGARPVLEVVAPGLRAVRPGRRPARRGRRRASPRAGPADPVSFALANRLVGNAAGAGDARAHRRRDAAALPRRRATSPWSAARPRCASTARRCPAGQVLPLDAGPGARGRAAARGAAAPTWRWRAGCSGPRSFGSSASDELCGLGAGPARGGAAPLRRAVGAAARRPPGARARPPRSTAGAAGRAARRAGPARRAVRPRRPRPARRRRVPRRGGQQPGRASGCAPSGAAAPRLVASGRASSTRRAW